MVGWVESTFNSAPDTAPNLALKQGVPAFVRSVPATKANMNARVVTRVERMALGGQTCGIVYDESRNSVISLIRGTLTGERIEAEIESKHKKHTQSMKVNILEFGNAILLEQPACAL